MLSALRFQQESGERFNIICAKTAFITLQEEIILRRNIYALIIFAVILLPSSLFAAEEVSLDAVSLSQEVRTENVSAEPLVVSTDYYSQLPRIYQVTIDSLRYTDKAKQYDLEKTVGEYLNAGKISAANAALGAAVGAENKSSLSYLGQFCLSVLPLAGNEPEAQLKFISGFVGGYGKSGLLVMAKDGVSKFRVYGKRRGAPYKAVPVDNTPTDSSERIYSGGRMVFIPLEKGEILKVDIYGSGTAKVKMWKMLQGGMNSKVWEAGLWEREVTVRGDKLF